MPIDKSMRILVVDDYRPTHLAIRNILDDLGFPNVRRADGGAEALQMMQQLAPFGAVISDWNMPGISGLQLLEWARRDQRYREAPFMLVTAEASRAQVRLALAAGVNAYLIKPFTPHTFTAKFWGMLDPATRVNAPPRPAPPAVLDSQTPALVTNEVVGLDAPLDERLKRSTVLIVDDYPPNIEVIAAVLKEDYTIKVATSGRKALGIVAARPPNIILLDIRMPEMDGFEVCRQLKANPATADIPVIILSSMDQPDDMVGALEIGAVDYVVKPVEPTILKARLRTHLRLATALGDLRRQRGALAQAAQLREDVERITRHDLKNPVGAILQTSHWLLERGNPTPGDLRQSMAVIAEAAGDALAMISRSLDLYKMEEGSYRPVLETLPLDDILARVAAEQRQAIAAKRIALVHPPTRLEIRAERLLCYSLFGNLLRNAVEAAPEGSRIRIDAARHDASCVIAIENAGAVPPEIRDRFFEKYVTHGKPQGTGLGTYSARLMAEVQGGSVRLDIDPGFTRLTVTLPAP